MRDRIEELQAEGTAAIAAAAGTPELEDARVAYLGRKAELPNLLRGVAQLAPEERGAVGRAANEARRTLDAAIEARREALQGAEIEDVFMGLGFRVVEGPETELVHYNFDALNHAPQHPSRLESDTFYVSDDVVLRTHTSPMQVRSMEREPPPIYIVVPGRTYRRDSPDATHLPQFNQVEGLAVDEDITLGDLQGTLLAFARAIFGEDRDVRLRPHFFPFTEPSIECDVSCFNCRGGYLADGSRCPLCKGTAWIEILGAGMVDPNVFEYVREHGYDPERVQGFAFGMGIERIAFLRHRFPDLRMLYENDLRFLEQFG